MLSIAQARAVVRDAVPPPRSEPVPIEWGLGRVLAEDVVAAHDVPLAANSAMDGFAVRPGASGTLRVVGESRAGAPSDRVLADGEAIRISTGAVVPAGAGGVLQIERVDDDPAAGTVTLRETVAEGRNVRAVGSDVRRGDVVLRAGTRLGPAELGVAVNAGRASLGCGYRPTVAVVATGDELAPPGAGLRRGQVHDSNRVALAALAQKAGAAVTHTAIAPDERAGTVAVLDQALEEADVLVVSGGVSVGPHDHVKPALLGLGVQERFWRVALRPGKPTWFGTREDKLVFGLPGNPVSSYVTFVLFARPALAALQGAPFDDPGARATLAVALPRHPDRDEAVRVALDADGRATPTGPQGSHVLTSLLGADALAIVPAGEGELPAGARVALEAL